MARYDGQRINLKDVDIFLEPDPNQAVNNINDVRGRLTGAEGATVTISADDVVAYEGGSYFPAEIVDGKVNITGSLDKAWLSNDFFKVLFPVQGEGRYRSVIKPTFTLKGYIANPKATLDDRGNTMARQFTLTGVKFNSLNIQNFTLDNYATQSMPFNATGYLFED